ncbi:SDR family NAD(P)-dependent oxidoreductase [Variovorax sp. WS11]|uniref:SDR family NAD(P)-dependent oxidoreductase n=1 Tax=Variovorax sp. WS11 TaxID=1105204 RepID=UPI0013DAE770|nr:SDR family NAD(P)-dependent oxidoreductase [Variovorax sp. WS11]NDZ18860.1 SDR family NAD(P)-dependent oxidoreductase [Variovorax sp. WS11]
MIIKDGTDRVATVTGGASGIGSGISQTLACDGFRIPMVSRSDEVFARAAELERQGHLAVGMQADLSAIASIQGLTTRVLNEIGRCDVLGNNAGTHIRKPDGQRIRFEEMTMQEWNFSLALHMTAPMLLCLAFLPGMKERGWGRIVNISSRAARTFTIQSSLPYAASKAGSIGPTRAIAGEFAPFGITCNSVAPGRICTSLTDIDTDSLKQASLVGIPAEPDRRPDGGRSGRQLPGFRPGRFVTGTTLDINGGAFIAP